MKEYERLAWRERDSIGAMESLLWRVWDNSMMGVSCMNSNDASQNGRVLFREYAIFGKSCIESREASESPLCIALENMESNGALENTVW